MGFTLQDDGTLDTVLTCDECGEELRYCSHACPEDMDRIEWAIGDAQETHECEEA